MTSLSIRAVFYPVNASPGEITAAKELVHIAGPTTALIASATPGRGVNVSLTNGPWAANFKLPSGAREHTAWTWLRIADDGTGEIVATHGSFLFAAVRLLANRNEPCVATISPVPSSAMRSHIDRKSVGRERV